MLAASPAHALPVGGQVSAGQASIASSAGQVTVSQSSQRVVINWKSFNVAQGQTVQFTDPNASSITLNRINDVNPSVIDGTIRANGQVWLINPQGIAFGRNAQVNVGGLLATSSDISDAGFMTGDYSFSHPGKAAATISNAGSLTAVNGGLIALAGPNVSNSGVIMARLGKVQLASGDIFTVDLYGDGLINLQASPAISQQLVANSGQIQADGGQVLLTAAAAESMVNSLVNLSGIASAESVGSQTGSVTVNAAGGTAEVVGTIDVSGKGSGQAGGSATVTGRNVALLSGSVIDASGEAGGGYVKIGGDFHGQGATPTAATTTVESGSLIDASAITSGNGGKVAVWSNQDTTFAGTILATGGSLSGDGGYVETSGHVLSALGAVNASAPHGSPGTWLLDPYDVTIAAGNGADANDTCSGNPETCSPNGGNVTIYAGNIDATLSGGTSLTITTGGSGSLGSSNGDIFVNGSIAESYAGNVSLTLQAYRDITINSNVSIASTSGPLNVTLDSATGNGTGIITLNSGASIVSGGGNITLGGGSNPLTMPAVGASIGYYAIQLNGTNTLNAGTGNISMLADGDGISAKGGNDLIKTTTGNIFMRADSSLGGGNEFVLLIDKGTTITTSTGNITLLGTAPNMDCFNCIGILTNSGSESGTTVISSTGTGANVGTITLTGTAYANGGSFTFGLNPGGGTISSVDGNIVLNGTTTSTGLDTPAYGFDDGINLNGTITSTGNGNITITGVGDINNANTNYGIILNGGLTVSAHDGSITLNGTGGGYGTDEAGIGTLNTASNTIISTGTAPITLIGRGANGSAGIEFSSNGNSIGGASAHGNITLIADSFSLGDTTVQTSANLAVEPYTSGTTVGVGTGTGNLSIPDSILGNLTYGSLTIGGSNAGAMDIDSGATFAAPITFQTGSGASITLGGALASSTGGTAFTMASGGNFINTAGSSAFDLTGGGRWLIYSANPADNTLDGLTTGLDRYSCTYVGSCPSIPGSGNGLLYSYTPELIITPAAHTVTYGQATPAIDGYTVSGYLTAADLASIGFSGAIGLSTPYALGSSVGTYNLTATAGTLADALGYGLTFATRTNGLTVDPKTLIVTAVDQSRSYGGVNLPLIFSYAGLVAGDTAGVFTGALATPANLTSPAGTYAISQGSLSAGSNYAISFTPGTLTVTPLAQSEATMPTIVATLQQANDFIDPTIVTVKNAAPLTLIYLGTTDSVPSDIPPAGNAGNPHIDRGSMPVSLITCDTSDLHRGSINCESLLK